MASHFSVAPATSGGLGYDNKRAGLIYGTYTMSVYMLSIPGGFIADNFLGSRLSVLYGGIADPVVQTAANGSRFVQLNLAGHQFVVLR